MNVVTVHREREAESAASSAPQNKEGSANIVHGALHSLRIIAQITQ